MLKRGFTLLEAVIVSIVIAILSVVIAVDIISSTAAVTLEAAKFKLKSDIIYAQNLAVTQQARHGVVFDPALETYSVYNQNPANVVNSPFMPLTPFTVNYATDANFKGVDLVAVSFGSPNTDRIEFDSFGSPYSNSTAALTADGTVTLSYRGANVDITVTKNTGKVH